MWGDMSLWNMQGSLLHSGDTLVQRILTVAYTFNTASGIGNTLAVALLICFQHPRNHHKTYLDCHSGGVVVVSEWLTDVSSHTTSP